MGTSASIESKYKINEELQKPIDASDFDGVDFKIAKNEVIRLRAKIRGEISNNVDKTNTPSNDTNTLSKTKTKLSALEVIAMINAGLPTPAELYKLKLESEYKNQLNANKGGKANDYSLSSSGSAKDTKKE